MSVSLQKGQKVSLTKEKSGLKKVMVGLGWDEAQPQSGKGLFASLFGGKKEEIDCDAVAFLLQKGDKLADKSDVVFYNNLRHKSGCVTHQGDNLTGAGEGDDEQILIDLANLPSQYDKIIILVSIYKAPERNQHFGMIRNAFIRLVDSETNKELCIYNLSENYDNMCSLIFGEIYRHDGEWKFNAIGQPLKEWAVNKLAGRYGLTWIA